MGIFDILFKSQSNKYKSPIRIVDPNTQEEFDWKKYMEKKEKQQKQKNQIRKVQSQEALEKLQEIANDRDSLQEQKKVKKKKLVKEIAELDKEIKHYNNFFGISEDGKKIMAGIAKFFKGIFDKLKQSRRNDKLVAERKSRKEGKDKTVQSAKPIFNKIIDFIKKEIEKSLKNNKRAETRIELVEKKLKKQVRYAQRQSKSQGVKKPKNYNKKNVMGMSNKKENRQSFSEPAL